MYGAMKMEIFFSSYYFILSPIDRSGHILGENRLLAWNEKLIETNYGFL